MCEEKGTHPKHKTPFFLFLDLEPRRPYAQGLGVLLRDELDSSAVINYKLQTTTTTHR